MKLSFIKYGKRKIKVHFEILKDYFGLYDPNLHTLHLDKRLKDSMLFNTLMHEMFHIIMGMENIDVNTKGEEPIAVAEDVKKPENKAVKKKSIFSRKKKK